MIAPSGAYKSILLFIISAHITSDIIVISCIKTVSFADLLYDE